MKKYLLVAALMTLAACGAGEEADTTPVTVAPGVTETTVHDDSMSDEEMSDEEMSDEEMSDEEMSEEEMTDDSSQG
ncbi:MAG: hypothetical protein ACFCVC_16610 [Acidimicrobiia bacterium]